MTSHLTKNPLKITLYSTSIQRWYKPEYVTGFAKTVPNSTRGIIEQCVIQKFTLPTTPPFYYII